MPKTAIRSRMVGLCLVSYSFGCISLNLLSLVLTDADSLMAMLTILIVLAVLPNYFILLESPMYLYKSGYVVSTINTLREIASRNNRSLEYKYFEKQLDIENYDVDYQPEVRLIKVDTTNKDKENKNSPKNGFYLLLEPEIGIKLLALCFQSATVFTIYYGLTSSIGELGLPSIQLNGILMGLT